MNTKKNPMSSVLQELKRGISTESYDGPKTDFLDQIPDDLDREKFERGRQFFIKNVSGCVRGMFLALVLGLSVDNLLDALVITGETSHPRDAFRRYLRTIIHVLKWHYGNIWDKNSCARKSIMFVRKRHFKARQFLENAGNDQCKISCTDNKKILQQQQRIGFCGKRKSKETGNVPVYISQYDMSLVQAGFIGIIILYPHRCGIRCTESELDDFVYVWRWIGYLLGIEDKNNICFGGYKQAFRILKAIEVEIILKSLANPPEQFEPMANAFLEGIKLASKQMITYRLNAIVGLAFEASGYPIPFQVSFFDRLHMILDYAMTFAMLHVPGIVRLTNFAFEMIFACRKMT